MTCPACEAEVSPGARFCASCGRSLRSHDDERRVVTVLFADIVGFTSLSERLDPERVKILVDRCFDRLAEEVTAFGGRVDKVVGDAVIALFGAPVAHEDDAERAVRAGLRMHEVLRDEAADLGELLQLRVGINTGEVVVGAMRAAGSITAMGDVVNTAARLQTAAEPGEVLVGPSTHAASVGAIAYEARGHRTVKGREGTVVTWRALAPISAPGERNRRHDLPLIGRDHELAVLQHAAAASFAHGRALFALLVADVGMGKSRLADELARWAEREHGALAREGRCLPYGEANIWWPVAEAVRAGVDVDGAPLDQARGTLRSHVGQVLHRPGSDAEVERVTEGLLHLLGYDAAPDVDSTTVREEAARSLGVYIAALGARRPLVVQISDLHFADDALLRLIDDVMANVHHRPVVVVATARPTVLDRWRPSPGRHHALLLHLDPLDRAAARRLLAELMGDDVPPDVADALLDRSGGNPFFLEELVSLVDGLDVDPHQSRDAVHGLPATLRGLVAARLDDLDADARTVLQHASVIGQQGPVQGLVTMGEYSGRTTVADVDAALDRLVGDGILERTGDEWHFRSDIVRDVAYQAITKTERAKFHYGIAQYLEATAARQKPRPAWVADRLAQHFGAAVTLAGELGSMGRVSGFPADLAAQARDWALDAARRARRDGAMPTAVRRFTQAIELAELDGLPDEDPDRYAELHLYRADVAVEAWDVDVARASLALLDELVPDPGSATQAHASVIRGQLLERQGDVAAAVDQFGRAIDTFGALGRTAERAGALRHRALAEIFGGRLEDAARSAEAAREAFAAIGGLDGEAWALQHLAWVAFVSGDTPTADAHLLRAIELFSQVSDTRGLAWGLGLLAWVRFQDRRTAEATVMAELVLDEARSRRDPWAVAMMTMLMSSIRLWAGATDEAVALASEARVGFTSLGNRYGIDQSTAVLGRAMIMAGRTEEGFALFEPRSASPGAVEDQAWHAAQMAWVAAAVQVGDVDRVGDAVVEVGATWGDDPAVTVGLLHLQRGDDAAAARHLAGDGTGDGDDPDGDGDPDRLAARSLWAAAAGRDDSAALVERVAARPGVTYLDRTYALLGAALRAAATGDPDGAASYESQARQAVGVTGDRVAQVVVDLAGAVMAQARGAADAADRAAAVDRRLEAMAMRADGWRHVFTRALAATAAPGLR